MKKKNIYKTGDLYVKKIDEKYKKLRIVGILEKFKFNSKDFDDVYVQFVMVNNGPKSEIQSEVHIERIGEFKAWPVSRVTHCWNCTRSLDRETMDICESCGWIECPKCHACKRKFPIGCQNYDEKIKKLVDPNVPDWYKHFKVSDTVKEFVKINLVQAEFSEKPDIICDVVVTSVLGTFVLEGYYHEKTDCVTAKPKYGIPYIDQNGIEKKHSAVSMNYDLHAFVLQTIDSILE